MRRAGRDLADAAGRGHVFGQVEVVATDPACRLGHLDRQHVGQRAEHGVAALQRGVERGAVLHVEHAGVDLRVARRAGQRGGAAIGQGDAVVGPALGLRVGQQFGHHGADLAAAEDEDGMHGGLSRVETMAPVSGRPGPKAVPS